jgi:hypothetical protein
MAAWSDYVTRELSNIGTKEQLIKKLTEKIQPENFEEVYRVLGIEMPDSFGSGTDQPAQQSDPNNDPLGING